MNIPIKYIDWLDNEKTINFKSIYSVVNGQELLEIKQKEKELDETDFYSYLIQFAGRATEDRLTLSNLLEESKSGLVLQIVKRWFLRSEEHLDWFLSNQEVKNVQENEFVEQTTNQGTVENKSTDAGVLVLLISFLVVTVLMFIGVFAKIEAMFFITLGIHIFIWVTVLSSTLFAAIGKRVLNSVTRKH